MVQGGDFPMRDCCLASSYLAKARTRGTCFDQPWQSIEHLPVRTYMVLHPNFPRRRMSLEILRGKHALQCQLVSRVNPSQDLLARWTHTVGYHISHWQPYQPLAAISAIGSHTEADLSRSTDLLINPRWLACLTVLSGGLTHE